MSGEVSRRGSQTSNCTNSTTVQHRYNTRFAARNNRSQLERRRSEPAPQSLCREVDDMDLCFERPVQQPHRICKWTNRFHSLILFSCVAFIGWSYYVMQQEIRQIEEKVLNLSTDRMREIVKQIDEENRKNLQDPVGRPDYALESTGGRIINVEASPYTAAKKKFLCFWFCDGSERASAVITTTTSPGDCWSFKGHRGSVIIQLIGQVLIDAVTLEHIPQSMSPSDNINSAPKDFKIWGLDQPKRNQRLLLGEFQYATNGSALQTFNTTNYHHYFEYVELEVLSNHGNQDYTCVYRLRVHGSLRKSE